MASLYIHTYMYKRTTRGQNTHVCLTRASVVHSAAVPRAFLTARPSVFVSGPKDLNRGEENWRDETTWRANERNGLFNRKLDSVTQVRAILVPFTSVVLLFSFSFLYIFFFSYLILNILNALNQENVLPLELRESQSFFCFFLFMHVRSNSKFFLHVTWIHKKNLSYKHCYIYNIYIYNIYLYIYI